MVLRGAAVHLTRGQGALSLLLILVGRSWPGVGSCWGVMKRSLASQKFGS